MNILDRAPEILRVLERKDGIFASVPTGERNIKDAVDLIRSMQSELTRAQMELDAAIGQLPHNCSYCKNDFPICRYYPEGFYVYNCEHWEWSVAKEDNDG